MQGLQSLTNRPAEMNDKTESTNIKTLVLHLSDLNLKIDVKKGGRGNTTKKSVAISMRTLKIESALASSNSAARVQTTLLGIGGVWYHDMYHK